MTNDGELAYHLAHPSQHVYKTYFANVEGIVSKEALWKLRNGITIDGRATAPANITIMKETGKSTTLKIEIYEGRNRQVRKMCTAVGHNVQELERVAVGKISLARLKSGNYRKLTKQEVDYLKTC
jgi:pseudouridine synthase